MSRNVSENLDPDSNRGEEQTLVLNADDKFKQKKYDTNAHVMKNEK